MTDVIKIIGIGLLALIIIVILKQYKPEFAIYVSMIAGVLILVLAIQKLTGIIILITSVIFSSYSLLFGIDYKSNNVLTVLNNELIC